MKKKIFAAIFVLGILIVFVTIGLSGQPSGFGCRELGYKCWIVWMITLGVFMIIVGFVGYNRGKKNKKIYERH